MDIKIHYCTTWNYKPRATSLVDELKHEFGTEAELVPGSNGVFDVVVDGEKIFSKFEARRFPNPGEVIDKIKE